jgi:hypothetical protein
VPQLIGGKEPHRQKPEIPFRENGARRGKAGLQLSKSDSD